MYNLFLLLFILLFLPPVLILYINTIREDFGKPKLIDLTKVYQNIYRYIRN